MKSSSKIFALFFFLLTITIAKSQSDSILVISDTSIIDSSANKKFKINYENWSKPERAGTFSAIIPGLGQAYNKKYWKVPLVYAAGGFLVASALYHHKEYKTARDGLINNVWADTAGTELFHPITMRGQVFYLQESYDISTENQYRTARDQQRGKRDLFIVYSALVYAVQIVDAIVDAHLNEFDLSDDLSLEIKPNFYNTNNTFAAGISLRLNLK